MNFNKLTPEEKDRVRVVNLIRELGVADFMKSEHAYDCWLVHDERHGQAAVTRGIPGKVPYAVGGSPSVGLGLSIKSHSYWMHYGMDAKVPIIRVSECI